MWLYAAFQKVYQREYHDGSYFYFMLHRTSWRLGAWSRRLGLAPPIEGDYGAIDAPAATFCRRLAVLVLVTETAPPILAFATTGTVWSPLLLIAVALSIGVLTSETNFMLTNVLLASVFVVPFDGAAFVRAFADPIVAGVVGWCLVWPPVHAVLARRLGFSPWKLAGWGMYSRQIPSISIVLPDGELHAVNAPAIPAGLLRDFGACRIRWLRDAVRRHFLRWGYQGHAIGLVFRWRCRRGDQFVTNCVVLPNRSGAALQTFEVCDERTAEAFKQYLSRLSHA
jgi:hypothetical protein